MPTHYVSDDSLFEPEATDNFSRLDSGLYCVYYLTTGGGATDYLVARDSVVTGVRERYRGIERKVADIFEEARFVLLAGCGPSEKFDR
jgi:hypothetical protein